MRRREMVLASAGLLSIAGCLGDGSTGDSPGTTTAPGSPTTQGPDSDSLVNPSFERNWAGWSVGRYLPTDPNRSGDREVASVAGVTTEDSTDGEVSLRLEIDGRQDDGTLWVEQPVTLQEDTYLAVDYRVSDSFNHIRNAAVYAGPEPDDPLTERDFDVSQSLEGHEEPGWRTFTYEVDHEGPGLVAVGFSVVWETYTTSIIDNVRISSEPPTTTGP